MTAIFRSLLKDEDGATTIEYALIAALVCMVIVAVLNNMNTSIQRPYDEANDALTNATR